MKPTIIAIAIILGNILMYAQNKSTCTTSGVATYWDIADKVRKPIVNAKIDIRLYKFVNGNAYYIDKPCRTNSNGQYSVTYNDNSYNQCFIKLYHDQNNDGNKTFETSRSDQVTEINMGFLGTCPSGDGNFPGCFHLVHPPPVDYDFNNMNFIYNDGEYYNKIVNIIMMNEWFDVGCIERIGQIEVSRITDFNQYKSKNYAKEENNSKVLNSIFNEIEERNTLRTKADTSFEVVYFPEGIYTFSEPIHMSSNSILKGDGTGYSGKQTKLLFDYSAKRLLDYNYNISIYNDQRVGIEDLQIERCGLPDNAYLDGNYSLIFGGASSDCWVRSVYSNDPISSHVSISNSHHIEIRDSYFNQCGYAGVNSNGYGVLMGNNAEYCLVENNIFRKLRHSMILADDAKYNAIAYNYSRERKNDELLGILLADICFHGHQAGENDPGPSLNLAEGNVTEWINFDTAHGGSGLGNIILNNRVKDDLTIEWVVSPWPSWTDANQDQIFVENHSEEGSTVDGWDIMDSDLIDGRNNKIKSGDWRTEYDSSCNIKTLLYDINNSPDFLNSFQWPFISWDYSTSNMAEIRYDGSHRVSNYGFEDYRYKNLVLTHDNLKGNYYSTGTVNINNTTVKTDNNLRLESSSNIIINPETKIELGSQVNLRIK